MHCLEKILKFGWKYFPANNEVTGQVVELLGYLARFSTCSVSLQVEFLLPSRNEKMTPVHPIRSYEEQTNS